MGGLREYHERQRKKDDEALHAKRQSETAWLTISHDGQELLVDILRSVIREEAIKVLKEVANAIIEESRNNTPDGKANLVRDGLTPIQRALLNISYRRDSSWNQELDIRLYLESSEGLEQGELLKDIHKRFADEVGFTQRAVSQRWVKLSKLVHELGGN